MEPKNQQKAAENSNQSQDSLQKREKYAVSLRNKKRNDILQSKRQKIMQNVNYKFLYDVEAQTKLFSEIFGQKHKTMFKQRFLQLSIMYKSLQKEFSEAHQIMICKLIIDNLFPQQADGLNTETLSTLDEIILIITLRKVITSINTQQILESLLHQTSIIQYVKKVYDLSYKIVGDKFSEEQKQFQETLVPEVIWIVQKLVCHKDCKLEDKYKLLCAMTPEQSGSRFINACLISEAKLRNQIIWFINEICEDQNIAIMLAESTQWVNFFGCLYEGIQKQIGSNMQVEACLMSRHLSVISNKLSQQNLATLVSILKIQFSWKDEKDQENQNLNAEVIDCWSKIVSCEAYNYQVELLKGGSQCQLKLFFDNLDTNKTYYPIVKSSIKLFTNILAGDLTPEIINKFIELGLLEKINFYFLAKENLPNQDKIVTEMLWGLSNFALEGEHCILLLLASDVLRQVIDSAIDLQVSIKQRREAINVLCNMALGANKDCAMALFTVRPNDLVQALVNGLDLNQYQDLVLLCLQTISAYLLYEDPENMTPEMFGNLLEASHLNALEKIDTLVQSSNSQISEQAQKITNFWESENDPIVSSNSTNFNI